MRATLLIATALLGSGASLGGCSVKFDDSSAQFSCMQEPTCPSGFECVGGQCVRPEDQADAMEPLPCLPTAHVVVSEVNTTPEVLEFIELANPTDAPVDLSEYFLADNSEYALTPAFVEGNRAPSFGTSDFIVQLPPGQVIEAGGTLLIARQPNDFFEQYDVEADLAYSDLIKIEPATGSPVLDNVGEIVVLFRWNGMSDLVTDVDAMVWGEGSALNRLADKTEISVDGPDADTETTTYQPDAVTTMPIDPGEPLDSMQRAQGEGDQELGASNGVNGEDETSEPLDQTWITAAPNPGDLTFCLP